MRFRVSVLVALCALSLAMCSQPAAVQAPFLAQIAPPAMPTVEPTAKPTSEPTIIPTAEPTMTPTPTIPRVGIQVGHWKAESMPDEQAKLRKSTGNYYRGYDEWEVNIVIAEMVRDALIAAGFEADLLAATVSPGYQADAFVSIHANGATTNPEQRRGWTLTAPWRASPAARALAEAVAETYSKATGLPEDPRGPSENMLGYYAFGHYRYHHSIAPTTPGILIETGYMTNAQDRAIIFEQPEIAARGIAEGIINFLRTADRSEAARQPVFLPMLKPNRAGIALLQQARANATPLVELAADTRLIPLGYRNGWYLVASRGIWDIGWINEADVSELDEPQTP